MKLPPDSPFSLSCCHRVIRAASFLVPEQAQPLSRRAWLASREDQLLDQWNFLRHTGLWNFKEAFLLLLHSFAAFPDAARQFIGQETLQQGFRRILQSPLTCLSVLAALLGGIALATGGLPATRDLIFRNYDSGGGKLVFAWLHNVRGGGDHPLPSDVIPAWNKHGKLVISAAAFRSSHLPVTPPDGRQSRALVVMTDAEFFQVMRIQPAIGAIPADKSVVLSHTAWTHLFHADPRILGTKVNIDRQIFTVSGVLPPHVDPLTRQPALYLLIPNFNHGDVFAALRVRNGVTAKQLNKELVKNAEDFTYEYLQGQLRYSFAQAAVLTPVWSFLWAAFSSALLLLTVFRMKWTFPRQAMEPEHRKTFARQALFFAAKTVLALACVFTACLEWSRSSSAILFGNFDPASGPFLLWLYIAGTMGVFFWTAIDQKARCRECLRLLVFPVRIGSPGSMLLNWSGTEFCCSEGHGVLHVPHLAPSWSDGPDHWISLDNYWQTLFLDDQRKRD